MDSKRHKGVNKNKKKLKNLKVYNLICWFFLDKSHCLEFLSYVASRKIKYTKSQMHREQQNAAIYSSYKEVNFNLEHSSPHG
jgi:hypothetical protein